MDTRTRRGILKAFALTSIAPVVVASSQALPAGAVGSDADTVEVLDGGTP